MRKLKILWRSAVSSPVCEEIETWASVLLALGAVLLLVRDAEGARGRGARRPRNLHC